MEQRLSKIAARYSLVYTLLLVLLCFNVVIADDSIPSRKLDEVTVVAERGWIENGVINIIPTNKEKRLSNSPASLIDAMNLTFVKEKDDKIVSLTGEDVSIFINGEPADNIDIKTFWPKNVRRVQYMENPADPNYQGARLAINFVMDKYEYGGVSRANLFEKIPNSGFIQASSKLVYKKMTYGAMIFGSYNRDHCTSMTGTTTYRDLFYNGRKYDEITRTEDSHSFIRNEYIDFAVNAKYASNNKIRMTHTFALKWDRNPGSGSHSSDIWTDDLFGSSLSETFDKSRTVTPQISGYYSYVFSPQWFMTANWRYSYADNNSSSWNRLGDSDAIFNGTDENVHSAGVSVLPSFMLSEKWYFQMDMKGSFDWFSTLYSGSADVRQKQSRQDISSLLRAFWIPFNSFSMTAEAGASAAMWQIGDVSEHTVNPVTNIYVDWNINRRLTLGGVMYLQMFAPAVSASNPVLVRNSELLWVLGNPHLKNRSYRSFNIYSTWLPSNWLSVSGTLLCYRMNNQVISTYTPAPAEMGGLIKENLNADPETFYNASVKIQAYVPGSSLSLGINPQWNHTHVSGPYRTNLSYISLGGNASYTAGDFRFKVWYEGAEKSVLNGGMNKRRFDGKLNVSAVYGNDNLNVTVRVDNILNDKRKSRSIFNSTYYSSGYRELSTGRCFVVNLTYTIDYGKKVDRGIDISGPESAKTSVISTAR